MTRQSIYSLAVTLIFASSALAQEPTPRPRNGVAEAKVHVVFAALTDDPSIGRFIRINVPQFEMLVKGQVRAERLGTFTTLLGGDCTAASILDAIDDVSMSSKDSLFVYYEGHGAYDDARANGDVDQGHFFQLPGRELMRKDLVAKMKSKKPRLTVLMSDCCNVKGVAQYPLRPLFEERTATIKGWSPLEDLLISHRGIVDATASSREEYSWFSNDVGGWFTTTFEGQLNSAARRNASLNWKRFWPLLSDETEAYFQLKKSQFVGQNPELDSQKHMKPMTFQFDVEREEVLDVPSKEIEILLPVMKLVAADDASGASE